MKLFNTVVKAWDAVVAASKKAVAWLAPVKRVVAVVAPIKRAVAVVVATVVGAVTAFAQSSGGSGITFADPSTITTTATTVFTAVATLMVGIVGFWVVLKIVRKISGR